MHLIVLAAGLGQRLGELTRATPKALISVAGRTLIDYALAFARQAGGAPRIVVGGFGYEELARHVAEVDPGATLVENRDFRQGNLLSLVTGRGALPVDAGFHLMNTDHIYPPGVARIVAETAATASEVTAFCDFDRSLGADDMKVELDAQRRVRRMSKQLAGWQAGYVGMTFVPAARRAAYDAAVERVRQGVGPAAHVEQVLVALAELGAPPVIADISGHGWHEVDEPHERDRAEAALRARPLQ
ncbi:MAG: NTP transferase domain-containing protein [Deltaproteobacteria bacterium]|nr:NTP transferase domain-containing protein [Deltaproteobacteria bacterium]